MMDNEIKPIYFAPIQGFTEAVYRNAHASIFGGVNCYCTPFVRLEKGEIRAKDLRDILPENNEVTHLLPQLIAGDVNEFESLVKVIRELGYKEVDVNMGCPFPLLTRRFKGCGILPYPDRVRTILECIAKHTDMQFSIKLRLGMESPEECFQLLPYINDTPLHHITLHPRLGSQQYKGKVDMEAFARFHEQCRHPLIYNGDLQTLEDIRRIEQSFPDIAGIMIGRGLLANPALAEEYVNGSSIDAQALKERIKQLHDIIYRHYIDTLKGGQSQLLSKLHAFWEYLEPQIDRKAYKKLMKCTSLDNYWEAVNRI